MVSHAGSRLLADLADRSTLTAQLSAVFADRVAPQTAHDPGRVLTDVAVMIADGGECISDIATLSDQPGVFGPVASNSTCWRILHAVTDADLAAIDAARAAAREVVWAQRAEVTGTATSDAGGRVAASGSRRAGGAGDRRGRHAGDRAQREGTGGRHVQTHVGLPSGAGLLR